MDELDLLKKHWQKNSDFPKVNSEEIKKMSHKSSSSIVKWIFIISLIELAFGLSLNLLPSPEKEYSNFFLNFELASLLVFYPVVIFFIYQFFKSYLAIKNTDSTKVLLENIIRTRKNVEAYIKFNIYYFAVVFFIVSVEEISMDIQKAKEVTSFLVFKEVCMFIAFAIIAVLFIMFAKYIYRLIYVRLLKKLNVNYDELKKLDSE
ncbi:hypothetical protein [Sphingobacterium hungaricum]|uniref:Uncharacterized protein n=1 Tax=Sphingobacterium hungaricum TaxID=2082723 RepID=A0A928YQK5_9SPHI|nr:hypothetical protein [Sphingobacterium hungaricum]MBE8714059.1 hypothetical protein [Sphingobacterium hungaricum]